MPRVGSSGTASAILQGLFGAVEKGRERKQSQQDELLKQEQAKELLMLQAELDPKTQAERFVLDEILGGRESEPAPVSAVGFDDEDVVGKAAALAEESKRRTHMNKLQALQQAGLIKGGEVPFGTQIGQGFSQGMAPIFQAMGISSETASAQATGTSAAEGLLDRLEQSGFEGSIKLGPLTIKKKQLSPQQKAFVGNFESLLSSINRAEQIMGTDEGFKGSLFASGLPGAPGAGELDLELSNAADVLLRLRSGAQINEREFRRLRKLLPIGSDAIFEHGLGAIPKDPGRVKAKLDKFKREAENILFQKGGEMGLDKDEPESNVEASPSSGFRIISVEE